MLLSRWLGALLPGLTIAALVACGDDGASGTGEAGGTTSGSSSTTSSVTTGGGGAQPFELTSSSFQEGEAIPAEHECGPPAPVTGDGGNLTPALAWTAGPAETRSYAIVVRDVDAKIPQYPDGIIHWVIYDIPADARALPEGIAAGYAVSDPAGAKQAEVQGTGFFGYFGPCSPNSVNTYVFTLHAMPEATLPGVTMDTSEADVAAIIESTSIATATLSGES